MYFLTIVLAVAATALPVPEDPPKPHGLPLLITAPELPEYMLRSNVLATFLVPANALPTKVNPNDPTFIQTMHDKNIRIEYMPFPHITGKDGEMKELSPELFTSGSGTFTFYEKDPRAVYSPPVPLRPDAVAIPLLLEDKEKAPELSTAAQDISVSVSELSEFKEPMINKPAETETSEPLVEVAEPETEIAEPETEITEKETEIAEKETEIAEKETETVIEENAEIAPVEIPSPPMTPAPIPITPPTIVYKPVDSPKPPSQFFSFLPAIFSFLYPSRYANKSRSSFNLPLSNINLQRDLTKLDLPDRPLASISTGLTNGLTSLSSGVTSLPAKISSYKPSWLTLPSFQIPFLNSNGKMITPYSIRYMRVEPADEK